MILTWNLFVLNKSIDGFRENVALLYIYYQLAKIISFYARGYVYNIQAKSSLCNSLSWPLKLPTFHCAGVYRFTFETVHELSYIVMKRSAPATIQSHHSYLQFSTTLPRTFHAVLSNARYVKLKHFYSHF